MNTLEQKYAQRNRNTIFSEYGEIISVKKFPGDQYVMRIHAPTCAAKAKPGNFVHVKCDDSLSMRMSCREGVCGSDAMNINGKNGLACVTKIDDLKKPIVIRPMPGLPVIRDLVVDMKQFFKHYDSIDPYLKNKKFIDRYGGHLSEYVDHTSHPTVPGSQTNNA